MLRASASNAAKTELRAGAPPDAEGGVIAAIPVGRGEVNLKRGGPHILLTGVKKPLGAYDSFLMTLTFERAGKVEVEVMVEEASVLEPAQTLIIVTRGDRPCCARFSSRSASPWR